ncbi:MAG: FAD-binding oxidoreductase [Leptospira sp.]|nr:FAD-binding oxidoreductase [Leptospira sp.]
MAVKKQIAKKAKKQTPKANPAKKKLVNLPEVILPSPEKVEAWGMNSFSMSSVLKPTSEKEIEEIFQYAAYTDTKIAFRGGGCSYGDAAINSEGIVVDLSNYNKIIDFDPKSGILTAESGVTIKQLWEFGIEKSFWPPVVSGTMFPTLGGALSMNIHGKNNFAVGTIGEHIQEFTFLTPKGNILNCSPKKNQDVFYSAISGFGMLGCFLEVKIKMKKIYSGKMKVWPVVTRNFQEMFDYFEAEYKNSDYLVGWVDAFGSGKNLGRGLIHKSINLPKGEDPDFPDNCKLENQDLPTRFLGIIPKSWMWVFMKPFSFPLGMRIVNYLKYLSGFLSNNKPYTQGHAEYSFLLDYVPNWKYMYKPGYMIQYQSFIPKENAQEAFEEIFALCQKRKIVSWLAVFKKHKPDPFLLTHSVDGYSMAMDFPASDRTREKVWALAYEMDEIVLKYGGKFYFAKDATLRPGIPERFFPKENLKKFHALKKKLDPKSILQTDLYKRIFLN